MSKTFSGGPSFAVNVNPVVERRPGHYWVSVQPNQNINTGLWSWTTGRSPRKPGRRAEPERGLGERLHRRGRRWTTCGIDAGGSDQVYRLRGTTGGPTTASASGPAASAATRATASAAAARPTAAASTRTAAAASTTRRLLDHDPDRAADHPGLDQHRLEPATTA